MLRHLFTAVALPFAAAHGVLTSPQGRPQTLGIQGVKLTPFSNAQRTANAGCGGADAGLGNVRIPTAAYRPGTAIQVDWMVTIPHNVDNRDTGVRIALHYEVGDSFRCNILRGGLEGDPGFDVATNALSAGPLTPSGTALANQVISTRVVLPNKTCDYCVLQWVWAARSDGGYYMGCADIAITRNGLMPDYTVLPPETGNELPRNQARRGYSCAAGNPSSVNGGAIAAVVIILLLLGCAALYYYYNKKNGGAPRPTPTARPTTAKTGLNTKRAQATPPNLTSVGSSGAAVASAPRKSLPTLEPGWSPAIDPVSGQTYYVHAESSMTRWDMPVASGAASPPPPPPPSAPSLPPGWTSAVDPASGQTYYVETASGVTQWDPPATLVTRRI